jgi:transaldolase
MPITNTRAESSAPLIQKLCLAGVRVNVTAMMTIHQVNLVLPLLAQGPSAYVSVFAGRIADSGRNPVPIMQEIVSLLKPYDNIELIWASPREVLNVVQANDVGCHIITLTDDLLKKISLLGKDLDQFSLETVRMFHVDAKSAGYSL